MCKCVCQKEQIEEYLKPIKWDSDSPKSWQVYLWKRRYNYSNYQTTHNIMYNINAIMSLEENGRRYTFDDKSGIKEYFDDLSLYFYF